MFREGIEARTSDFVDVRLLQFEGLNITVLNFVDSNFVKALIVVGFGGVNSHVENVVDVIALYLPDVPAWFNMQNHFVDGVRRGLIHSRCRML